MAKAKTLVDAKGIYHRDESSNYWLRYSFQGKQVRVSLETDDYLEAVRKAKNERGKPPYERQENGTAWADAVNVYIAEKLAGKKDGRNCKKFGANTARDTRIVLLNAAHLMGVSKPADVTMSKLEGYYEHWQQPGPLAVTLRRKQKIYKRKFKNPRLVEEKPIPMRKGSEASARTQVNCVQAFLSHVDCLPGRVVFQGHREKRDVVVPQQEIQALLKKCAADVDLTYILLMGFYAGLRKSEIIAVRPSWIRMDLGIICIPAKEEQLLADKKTRKWKTKTGKGRKIPMEPQVVEFFQAHPELRAKNRLFVLRPEATGKKGFRWDPRRPFKNLVAHLPGVSMHTMRHTFISHLAQNPKIGIGKVAAWSGDTLQTIDKNYFHGAAHMGDLDDAFEKPASEGWPSDKASPEQQAIEDEAFRIECEQKDEEAISENARTLALARS